MAFLSKTTGHVGRPNSLTSGGGQFRTIGHQRNAALVNLSGLTVTRNRRRGCFSVLPLVTYINHATDHDVYAVVVVYIAFAALALVVGYCAQVWIDERRFSLRWLLIMSLIVAVLMGLTAAALQV